MVPSIKRNVGMYDPFYQVHRRYVYFLASSAGLCMIHSIKRNVGMYNSFYQAQLRYVWFLLSSASSVWFLASSVCMIPSIKRNVSMYDSFYQAQRRYVSFLLSSATLVCMIPSIERTVGMNDAFYRAHSTTPYIEHTLGMYDAVHWALPLCQSWFQEGLRIVQWYHQESRRRYTNFVVLDFAKAFDKVKHRLLVAKLDHYGIRGAVNGWIASFLTDRQQAGVVDGSRSAFDKVRSGVPQGSVLGSYLFLTYLNDLPAKIRSNTRLFADDTTLDKTIKKISDTVILQEDLEALGEWERQWDMELHTFKCMTCARTKEVINNSRL